MTTSRRGKTLVAIVAVWLVVGLGLGAPPAIASASRESRPLVPPIDVVLSVSGGRISLFSAYPDMALCEMALLTNCYLFEDGAVVGQFDPLAVLTLLFGLLNLPARGCTTVPSLGTNPNVREVYDGSGLPMILAAGSCANLPRAVADHREVLIVPFATETISPTAISIADLSVPIPPRIPPVPASG